MAGKRISELLRSNPLPTDVIPIGREEGLLTLGVTVASLQDDFTEQKYDLLNNRSTFTVTPSTNNMTVVLSCGAEPFQITISEDPFNHYKLGTCVYFTSINESNTEVLCTESGFIQYESWYDTTANLTLDGEFRLKRLLTEIQPFQTIKLQYITPNIWLLGFAFGGTTVVTGGAGAGTTGGGGSVKPPAGTTVDITQGGVDDGTQGTFVDYITDTTIVIETSAIVVDEETNPNLFMATIETSGTKIVSINDDTTEIVTTMGRAAYFK